MLISCIIGNGRLLQMTRDRLTHSWSTFLLEFAAQSLKWSSKHMKRHMHLHALFVCETEHRNTGDVHARTIPRPFHLQNTRDKNKWEQHDFNDVYFQVCKYQHSPLIEPHVTYLSSLNTETKVFAKQVTVIIINIIIKRGKIITHKQKVLCGNANRIGETVLVLIFHKLIRVVRPQANLLT